MIIRAVLLAILRDACGGYGSWCSPRLAFDVHWACLDPSGENSHVSSVGSPSLSDRVRVNRPGDVRCCQIRQREKRPALPTTLRVPILPSFAILCQVHLHDIMRYIEEKESASRVGIWRFLPLTGRSSC